MKNNLILICFLICCSIFYSCNEEAVIIPPDVLSKDELTLILTDLQIAQASQVIFEYSDTVKHSVKHFQMALLKKKNISEEKFTKSMKFYSDNPELLKDIYNEVVIELSKMQGELDKK